MLNKLLSRLGFKQHEKDALGATVGSIKDISEYLSDVVDMAKDSSYVEAVVKSAPWAATTLEAAGDVLPPIKFAVKLFEELTKEHDPEALGHLACTLAYQRAIEETVKAMEVPIVSVKEVKDLRRQLTDLEPDVNVKFDTFSFDSALSHPFVRKADEVLKLYSPSVGYTEEQSRRLLGGVHIRFVGELKRLLSNGSLKDRFEPFTTLIQLDAAERQAYQALSDHAEYQRWLFQKAPVLKKEPYTLTHIYVNTDCGDLTWAEIRKGSEKSGPELQQSFVDPFSETDGGRHPLLDTVIDLIASPTFKDAIVIQGVAGAGKSSFTLKLCVELLRQGLRPIRIRLKDVRLDVHVHDALPKAVRFGDEDYPGDATVADDLFLGGNIFKEQVEFRGTKISPYVLILDGWDEISIAGSGGYRLKVAKLLDELRNEYLRDTKVPIRLILTGRPSTDVAESKFFRELTRVLTIRPMTPDVLEKFVGDLHSALKTRPLKEIESSWEIKNLDAFASLFKNYREEFEATLAATKDARSRKTWETATMFGGGSMAVLGLPLLAHLAIRMIAKWPGDPTEFVSNPTTLYRSLVDLTCAQSGKAPEDADGNEGQLRLSGITLRKLLWQTATAMTTLGQESIPYPELELRIDAQKQPLYMLTDGITRENLLSSLMISFYFRGGQTQLGAEFVHKSFREYLFAEAVVELLKGYARAGSKSLPERAIYWKEFADEDPRFELAHNLAKHLSPQWISLEVSAHLEKLIEWELKRADQVDAESQLGQTTTSLELAGWEQVREALADIWDWWCEGVHLRPQHDRNDSGVYNFGDAFVQKLIEISSPLDVQQKLRPQVPNRTVTMDAHLGDGLFRLSQLVHYGVAVQSGWLTDSNGNSVTPPELWDGVSPIGKGPRRNQTSVKNRDREWLFFAPSGSDSRYFGNYCHRINGAGWRPMGPFPLGLNLKGLDLRKVVAQIPYSEPSSSSSWTHSNLSEFDGTASYLVGHDFSEVLASAADLSASTFFSANFKGSHFDQALFTYSSFLFSYLSDASFVKVNFIGADVQYADFSNSNLQESDFRLARISSESNFEGAKLDGAKIDLSDLQPPFDFTTVDTKK